MSRIKIKTHKSHNTLLPPANIELGQLTKLSEHSLERGKLQGQV